MENVTLAVAKSYAEELLMGQGAIQGADGFSPIIVENASNTDEVYKLDITTKDGTFTTTNLVGKQGIQGIQGERGEQGETGLQGQQGIQGIKGDKGDDGYPFLIYKQYEVGIEEFNEADYPEIGLMFMVHVWEDDKGYPVYRYTADGTDTPYSLVTHMNTEGIKGEKGDKGDTGEQGIAGLDGRDGKDGSTYTPSIGEVTTVDNTELASVSVSIKEETKEAVFNFAIPKGQDGEDGKDAEVTQYGLVTNAQNFKIDLTKRNASWYGMFTFNFIYGSTPCEINFVITDKVYYTITKGQNVVSAITYTRDGANYIIGIDFIAKMYGTQVVEMPSEFGIVNSFTAEQFTGDTSSTFKGYESKTITSLSELGLTADATLDDAIAKLRDGQNATLSTSEFTNYQTLFPYSEEQDAFASVRIEKSFDTSRTIVTWVRKDGSKIAYGGMGSNNQVVRWNEYALKSYVDSKIADLQAQIDALKS